MGKFNSDDHYIYYCEPESLRKSGVVLIVNRGVQNAYLGAVSKDRMISVPGQTIQHHNNPSVCPSH